VIDFSVSWIKGHRRMCIQSVLAPCPEHISWWGHISSGSTQIALHSRYRN